MVTSSKHLYLLIPPVIPHFLPCILEVYRHILHRCRIETPKGPEPVWLFRTQNGAYWAQKSFNACWLNIQPRLHEITGYLRWPHFTQSLISEPYQRFNNISWWIEFRLQKQISLSNSRPQISVLAASHFISPFLSYQKEMTRSCSQAAIKINGKCLRWYILRNPSFSDRRRPICY